MNTKKQTDDASGPCVRFPEHILNGERSLPGWVANDLPL